MTFQEFVIAGSRLCENENVRFVLMSNGNPDEMFCYAKRFNPLISKEPFLSHIHTIKVDSEDLDMRVIYDILYEVGVAVDKCPYRELILKAEVDNAKEKEDE